MFYIQRHFNSLSSHFHKYPYKTFPDIHLLYQDNVSEPHKLDAVLRPPIPQVLEVSGSESPSVTSWNSKNHRVRHDVSRARLRAIESSLENGQVWIPPSPSHRKTWEEEVKLSDLFDTFIILTSFASQQKKNMEVFFFVPNSSSGLNAF